MTTEAENDCHWIGYGKSASPCGLPFPETLGRWTNVREDATCPACLTAMGEPRVISGLDAVATAVESVCAAAGRTADKLRSGLDAVAATPGPTAPVVHWSPGDTLVPACGAVPRAGADVLVRHNSDFATCPACLDVYRAAAPPPPARPSRVEVGQRWRDGRGSYTVVEHSPPAPGAWHWPWKLRYDDGLPTYAGASILADEFLGLAAPVETRRAAAPAPVVGEGPREMTFPEAMLALAKGEPVECWARSRNEWEPVPPLTGTTLLNVAKVWATQRYRHPEPLPAPAPRVSRVRELVREYLMGEATAEDLCERVVKAVMAEVNCRVEHGASPTQVAAVEELFVGSVEPR